MANDGNREPRLLTAGVLAERLGVPLHRVTYILRTRRHIRPVARAGTLRLYDAAVERLVRAELGPSARRGADRE